MARGAFIKGLGSHKKRRRLELSFSSCEDTNQGEPSQTRNLLTQRDCQVGSWMRDFGAQKLGEPHDINLTRALYLCGCHTGSI